MRSADADRHRQRADAGGAGPPPEATVLSDLELRIHEIESADDDRFGRFTRTDWLLTVIGSLLVPYLLLIWFWP